MELIKKELQSIAGSTEKELILKAIRKFGWEHEPFSDAYEKIFR